MNLSKDIIFFLKNQHFVIVSTISQDGSIHCSAKGIVGVYEDGRVYVIDLYHNRTYNNLKNNPIVSITQVDEHTFKGYTLKGKAKIVYKEDIHDEYLKEWERKVLKRISDRLIKSVQRETASNSHHEAHLPAEPKYLIEIDVDDIVDLSPPSCFREGKK
ncbi:MAG: pyridoxamine 5'-phosphate oxidase family protein [Candidatus Omnitrophica bacterium]|nr:pyridoxamine 5'-phosphate oxidase family protein [Candidatus Omnitrophota bacterium]MDD5081556.1 pyridoxamine 5'-phosphate oxidase family protein [Candidatus Omnitrophota bacterium]MDD5440643.1 pyridoxamine 5'-phosphate oxidase family protein [Candidatus Omnitrophota bacterium]